MPTTESQSFPERILKGQITNSRIASTYLLTGGSEKEREAFAIATAKAFNCLKDRAFEFCECESCCKIDKQNHPDVRLINPEKDSSIKIEDARNLKEWVSFKPYEGRMKVAVLYQADSLTRDAQNALLKTLEEPPAHSAFLLIAQSRTSLLETIVSRAFEIRFSKLGNSTEETLGRLRASGLTLFDRWEDWLEKASARSRDESLELLSDLAEGLAYVMERFPEDKRKVYNLASALEQVLEVREAVEDNANVKLAFTRLAVRLRNRVSIKEMSL